MIGTIVPIVGLVLGLIFLAVGGLILRGVHAATAAVGRPPSGVTLSKR